jgi:endonuclease/exonuclease/phosphatase family metal-dependent hydrolase
MSRRLRLLTFNCYAVPTPARNRARLATLGRTLDRAGHDIVCLQEVQSAAYLPLLRRSFPGFPHLVYQPALPAPLGGLVMVSRWPVERADFIPFRARGPWLFTPAIADRLLRKGMLIATIAVRGAPVIVVNTHLLANYRGDWTPGARYVAAQRAQLRQLADVVNGLDRRLPVIVAGDFNVPRGSWLYDEFVAATGLRDPLAGDGRPTYRPAFPVPARYALPFDLLLVRPPEGGEVAASARLVFEEKTRLVTGWADYLSDHYGVEAVVEAR